MSDPQVEAVAIATPVATHFEVARQALSAGKHVFVEKPITTSIEEASQLIRLAKKQQRLLMVDHLLIHHPAVQRLREIIQAGILGEVLHIQCSRMNFGVVRTDENALWSLGPHDVSVILYLLDEEPSRVQAHGSCLLQKGIEDVVTVALDFPSRRSAHMHLSWLSPEKVRKLSVVGESKMAVFDDTASEKLVLLPKAAVRSEDGFVLHDGPDQAVVISDQQPLRVACQHFIDCIQTGSEPLTDGNDGLRVLRVLDAAQRSLDLGGEAVVLAGSDELEYQELF